MLQLILQFLIFFLSFVILPFGESPFELPKVITSEIGILLLGGILLWFQQLHFSQFVIFKRSKKAQSRFRFPHILISPQVLLILLFLLSLFHLIFFTQQYTFFGNPFRGQGSLLLWVLLLYSFLIPQSALKSPSPWLISSLLCLQLLASLFIGDTDGRAVGTLGEPNALAASVLFLWPWILVTKRKNVIIRGVLILSLVISLLIIIFSGSRSGFIAFCIQLVFLFLSRYLPLKKTVVVSLVLVACSLLLPILDTHTIYENRGEIWRTALIAGYQHPIAGWGFGNTEAAFKTYNQKLYNRLRGYYVDSSHNLFLDWWVQGGIIGLGLITLLLIETVRGLLDNKDKTGLVLLLGLVAVMSFNPVSVATLIQFWYLVGRGGIQGSPH